MERVIKAYDIIESDERLKNNESPKVVIADMDETLCNIAHVCVSIMHDNPEIFNDYFKLDEPYSEEDVCQRNTYYLEEWLKRDNIEVPEDIVDIMNCIFSRPDFYDYCQPTNFAKALKKYAENDRLCKKIYIVTTIVSEDQIPTKTAWLNKIFGEGLMKDKIEFCPVMKGIPKSKFVIDNSIEWDIFADDSLENVIDMILYAEGFGKEVLIPTMGYNQPTEKLARIVENFNVQLFYLK